MLKPSTFKATLLLLALFTLSGCDSIPFVDNTSDYKGASRGRPLEVPPDLTSISTNDTYTVPGSGTTYSAYNQDQAGKVGKEEVLLPESDSVKFERSGTQRWLVVKAPPEKVWPVVREFWTDLGFAVVVENPQAGVMETEWIDPADLTKDEKGRYLDKFQGWLDKMSSLSNRQKFRTRIDRGEDAGEDDRHLVFERHGLVLVLLEHLDHALAAVDLGPRALVKFRAELGERGEFPVLSQVEAEFPRHLPHGLGLGLAAHARNGNTRIDGRTHARIKQVAFEVNLAVGDGNDVRGNVRGNVPRLRFDDGKRGERPAAQRLRQFCRAFE